MCQAWKYRKQSPVIRVQGGVNARIASIECVSLAQSEAGLAAIGRRDPAGMAARFAQVGPHAQRAHFSADDLLVVYQRTRLPAHTRRILPPGLATRSLLSST